MKLKLTKVFSRTLTILGYDVTFVFRYKGDDRNQEMSDRLFKNEYKLGIFYKKGMAVKETTPTDGSLSERFGQFVPTRMFGMDLIWCKFWITWDKDALKLGEDEN